MREAMVPGATLPEQLAWLERVGIDPVVLTASTAAPRSLPAPPGPPRSAGHAA